MSLRRLLTLAAFLLAALALGIFAFVRLGVYDISAKTQHTGPVFRALMAAKSFAIEARSEDISVPDLDSPDRLERGAGLYERHCVACHGAPGVARAELGMSMNPHPPNLVHTARERSTAYVFWAVKNGIKMTGMPAWEFRMPEDDLWAVTAFVEKLPQIVPAEYRRRTGRPQPPSPSPGDMADDPVAASAGNADNGKRAMSQYACTTCHIVPGVAGRDVRVGPTLEKMGQRRYIAGILPNTPENMVRWLRNPPGVDPDTAMPDLGVTSQHARDIAAYLRTLSPSGRAGPDTAAKHAH